MAASPVLADSSFYIRLLRQGQDPLRALALSAASRDLVICGVVRCEVARALRPQKVRDRFRAFWDVNINVPTDSRLWERVEQTLWELDRQGAVLPLTDVVIACCAQRVDAVVLTYDKHFSLIPGVRSTHQLEA
ncbi:MAG TPA: PIN domain-containing protein [Verrucomicrobiae bacterium]|nr:PIN domain-containing protein [Verrucomicrobiae bacterium]